MWSWVWQYFRLPEGKTEPALEETVFCTVADCGRAVKRGQLKVREDGTYSALGTTAMHNHIRRRHPDIFQAYSSATTSSAASSSEASKDSGLCRQTRYRQKGSISKISPKSRLSLHKKFLAHSPSVTGSSEPETSLTPSATPSAITSMDIDGRLAGPCFGFQRRDIVMRHAGTYCLYCLKSLSRGELNPTAVEDIVEQHMLQYHPSLF